MAGGGLDTTPQRRRGRGMDDLYGGSEDAGERRGGRGCGGQARGRGCWEEEK